MTQHLIGLGDEAPRDTSPTLAAHGSEYNPVPLEITRWLVAIDRDSFKAMQAEIQRLTAENAALRAEMHVMCDVIAEWNKLRDPHTLHVNLLRGFPARLTRPVLLHLAGDEEPKEG
jgi:hypothetical protein